MLENKGCGYAVVANNSHDPVPGAGQAVPKLQHGWEVAEFFLQGARLAQARRFVVIRRRTARQCVKSAVLAKGRASELVDQHFVGVTPISEQGPVWRACSGFLGELVARNNYKTPGLGPAVRLVGKFRTFPAVLQVFGTVLACAAPDRAVVWHDCIAEPLFS